MYADMHISFRNDMTVSYSRDTGAHPTHGKS